MIDLEELSEEEMKEFLDSFDTVISDCDGVQWLGDMPIPGSKDTMCELQALGKRCFFISNNATLTIPKYVSKLTKLGYSVTEDDIITPAVTAAWYLRSRGITEDSPEGKRAFVIASKGFTEVLASAGVTVLLPSESWPEKSYDAIRNHLNNLDSEGTVSAIVMDWDANISYLKLQEAVTLLKKTPECEFIVGATDNKVPIGKDEFILGPSYFIQIVEQATGRAAMVAGKPSPLISEMVLSRHPIDPARTLFIGDTIHQDMAQGTLCGFQTILVLSGVSTLADAVEAESDRKPQRYAMSLSSLLPAARSLRELRGLPAPPEGPASGKCSPGKP